MKELAKKLLVASLLSILVILLSCSSPQTAAKPQQNAANAWAKSPTVPQRLLLLTIDQFQEEYIETYALKNFQAFRQNALRFPNAYVGHLPSINVVSHAVLTTGLLPKNLPFQDRILNDWKGDLGKKGRLFAVELLKKKQFEKLLRNTAETNLHTRLKYGHRGDTFTIGNSMQNAYALGSPYSDLVITLDNPKKSPPQKGWCIPVGTDVPDYFLYPFAGRFFIDCQNPYGTENMFLPLQGNQLTPGNDPNHLGGDTWVTDGILEIMKQEADWRAIFSNFASVDTSLSLYGQYDGASNFPEASASPIELKKTLENLDLQFGKILHYLEEKNLLKETLIVLTSTHGGQKITNFHGAGLPPKIQGQKLTGQFENYSNLAAPAGLNAIYKTGLVNAVSFDSTLKFFLNTTDTVKVSKLATQISELPGVMEVYTRQRLQYVRNFRHKEVTGPTLEWAREKHQELISSMTNQGAPDVVALLFNNTGYGTYGDSGCAFKTTCQHIPVLIWSPNIEAKESPYPIRTVDINPVISRIMQLKIPVTMDGSKAAVDSLIVDP